MGIEELRFRLLHPLCYVMLKSFYLLTGESGRG